MDNACNTYKCLYMYSYIYIYTFFLNIYIYIYIYICIQVGPGSSLGVSVAFPLRFRHVSVTSPFRFRQRFHKVSTTFPSRFCCVSVRVSAVLPLGKRLPDGNYPQQTRPALWCCCARAAEQIRNKNCFGTVAPTSSRNLRYRVRSRGRRFEACHPICCHSSAGSAR